MELKEDNTSALDAELKKEKELNFVLKGFLNKVAELKKDEPVETLAHLINLANLIKLSNKSM